MQQLPRRLSHFVQCRVKTCLLACRWRLPLGHGFSVAAAPFSSVLVATKTIAQLELCLPVVSETNSSI